MKKIALKKSPPRNVAAPKKAAAKKIQVKAAPQKKAVAKKAAKKSAPKPETKKTTAAKKAPAIKAAPKAEKKKPRTAAKKSPLVKKASTKTASVILATPAVPQIKAAPILPTRRASQAKKPKMHSLRAVVTRLSRVRKPVIKHAVEIIS